MNKVDNKPKTKFIILKEQRFYNEKTIIEHLEQTKNYAMKTILQAIELAYGKDSKWPNIRRIILRAINDYHRIVISVIKRMIKN